MIMMGRLEKLRSRLFSKRDAPSKPSTTDLSMQNTSINSTAVDLTSRTSAISCSVHKAGGQLYWNARRIRSDPTTSRPASQEDEQAAEDPAVEGGELEVAGQDAACRQNEWIDDDVFLENCEDQEPLELLEEFYHEVITLQRTHGWVWPYTASLTEDTHNSWEDWRVPAEEVIIEAAPLACTSRELVYGGYWHGRVSVRTREASNMSDIIAFLREVHTLSCIRHPNIQLFMGASVSPSAPRPLMLIMSEVRGQTLHTRLHSCGHSFTGQSKLQILHQIAEGMAYLHAKHIPHGLLTSTHVTLTCQVCISLTPQTKNHHQYFHPPELSYLPPECIRTLCVSKANPLTTVRDQQTLVHEIQRSERTISLDTSTEMARKSHLLIRRECDNQTTAMFQADIFAFGTIAYELSTLQHPFNWLPRETLLLCVGRGLFQSLDLVRSKHLRGIIRSCWSYHGNKRPSFRQLTNSLEHNPIVTSTPITKSTSLPSLHTSS